MANEGPFVGKASFTNMDIWVGRHIPREECFLGFWLPTTCLSKFWNIGVTISQQVTIPLELADKHQPSFFWSFYHSLSLGDSPYLKKSARNTGVFWKAKHRRRDYLFDASSHCGFFPLAFLEVWKRNLEGIRRIFVSSYVFDRNRSKARLLRLFPHRCPSFEAGKGRKDAAGNLSAVVSTCWFGMTSQIYVAYVFCMFLPI
jgi:hypothetical protein